MIVLVIWLALLQNAGHAQPVSVEAWQMQRLINAAEAQLKSTRELLKSSNQDAKSLEMAARSLEKLTLGLEHSIAQYQGTKEYQDALFKLQQDGGVKLKAPERSARFQAESVRANATDMDEVKKLSAGLRTAEPGFVPKIAAEAQLGTWQSNARISAQLTEVLNELAALGDRAGGKNQEVTGLAALIQGSDLQNQKQREAMSRGAR